MLIVIEGLDGSGKATQSKLLAEYINNSLYITFPDYNNKSSELVKMYLNKEIKDNANDVNPYAASIFYAADRYISYVKHWETDYKNNKNIIADRYSMSNIIHQMSKLPESEWDIFISWVYDFEFERMKLPRANLTFFLYVPVEISQKLLSSRYNNDDSKKDIHESNIEYLKKCEKTGLYAAEKCNWVIINCVDENNNLRDINSIQSEIRDIYDAFMQDNYA